MNDIDLQEVERYAGQVEGALVGAATIAMAALGDRLGLYRSLAEHGRCTAEQLASATGYHERYLREWLAQQAAVGLISHEPPDRFSITAEAGAVLAVEESPAFFGGGVEIVSSWFASLDQLSEAFRTGGGIAWGEHAPGVQRGCGRFFGAAYRARLIDEWIPALGLDADLTRGVRVADVGCGHGVSTTLLASRYPASTFIGLDSHDASIEAARKRAADAGVADRVQFVVEDVEAIADHDVDVVFFFDTIHDLGDPAAATRAARRALDPSGTLVLVEPVAEQSLTENLANNRAAALHYAASTVLCVPHARAHHGEGLGAQAGPQVLGDIVHAAGFGPLRRVAVSPVHAVYAASVED